MCLWWNNLADWLLNQKPVNSDITVCSQLSYIFDLGNWNHCMIYTGRNNCCYKQINLFWGWVFHGDHLFLCLFWDQPQLKKDLGPTDFLNFHMHDVFNTILIKPAYTVPPKKYTLLSSRVLKTKGGQMESMGYARHSIELVQTRPSLILKFKEMAKHQFQNESWSSLDQLNGWCGACPTLPLLPLAFEYLPLTQVYTFFWWRLYQNDYIFSWHFL